MSGDAVDVSVLVPIRNEAAALADTSALILAQDFEGTVEFFLIDGMSSDGTRAILDQLATADPRVRVLENPREVVPCALNIGLANARGRYIVRMDAHSWYPPDYVSRGIRRLSRDDVPWVAGPAVPRGDGVVSRAVARALDLPLGRGGSRKWAPDGDTETDLDTGVFGGVWRRETLDELGGWDESWTVNEDAEMAGRVLSRGGRIVCVPAMAAQYAPRETFTGLARQYWRFGYFRVKTSRRHPIALRRFHVAAAGLALTPLAAALAPRAYRRAARLVLVAYGALVARAAIREDGSGAPADPLLVASALAVMHFSWGAGFLSGCARFGLPLRGILRAVRGSARS